MIEAKNSQVLVLGAYGLIGAAVCRELRAAGLRVTGAGRNAQSAARVLPGIPFRYVDLARTTQADWHDLLQGITHVVNCAGALQDSPHDNLEALQHHAPATLGNAAALLGIRVVQISAVGAREDAATPFMASKARGDAALLRSGADVVVLRPGLVLGQAAYGGSLLLRMLAAVPLVQPLAMAHTPIQSTALADVTQAVLRAVTGEVPGGTTFDLVEDASHSLADVVAAHRHALGFAPAWWVMQVPTMALPVVKGVADLLGRLGWRSPLRSTAIVVLEEGIRGDPQGWRDRFGALMPLDKTLEQCGLDSAHRLQARAALLMPLAIAVLAVFWALSGVIGLWQIAPAAQHLIDVGWSPGMARTSVAFWAVVDLALAAAVLYRPWAARACLGMLAVSAIYLGAATLFTPGMWADPLGPMVKVLPSMMLAAVTPALLQTR